MQKHREPNKSLGLIGACSENVVVFAEKMLGVKLYAWQVQFLMDICRAFKNKDETREFLALTSRQIGKSTSIAIFAVWATIFNKYPGTLSENTSVGIASASDVQAKKLLYEMKKYLRLGDRFLERTYQDEDKKPMFGKLFFSDLLSTDDPNNTTTITFKPHNKDVHGDILLMGSLSGSVIKSYPPTSAVLGETFSVVIIDEAGKTDKLTDMFFYDFMYPTGNSTNAIRIYTSTPWVSSGFFYRLVDPDDIYGVADVSICLFTVDAIKEENPDYYKTVMKTVDQLNRDGKTDEVQRAYYCRFIKGEQSYFDPMKTTDVFTKEYDMVGAYNGLCDMGVDFGGQTISRSVITITELREDNTIRRLFTKTYEVGKDNSLIADIELLKKDFNIQRIIPDDCPQGDYLIREMKDKGWDVHPMNFRSEKVKKYGAFRASVNRGEVESYYDDELKTEMLALEQKTGNRQSVIGAAPGYRDDLIDSFVLSAYFFVQDDNQVKMFDWNELGDGQSSTAMERVKKMRGQYEQIDNHL